MWGFEEYKFDKNNLEYIRLVSMYSNATTQIMLKHLRKNIFFFKVNDYDVNIVEYI